MTQATGLPSLHWPSFGIAMAFEGSGLVITALLLEWTTVVPAFDGSFYPLGIAMLVPGFLIGWLVITLPWMASRYVRERDLGVGYVGPAVVRALVTFWSAQMICAEGEAREALFILGCLGGGWLLASVGIYSFLWSHARKHGRLGDPRQLPIPPELVLFTALCCMLLVVAWLQVEPIVWESLSVKTLLTIASIWALSFLTFSVLVASWRSSGRDWNAPRLLLAIFLWVAFTFLAHQPVLPNHAFGFWAELFFPGARYGIWGIGLVVVPSIYAYLALLRDPRPFAPALPRSGWAAFAAFGAELLLLVVLTDFTETHWLLEHGIGGLHASDALIPLVLAWLCMRGPAILLSDPRRGMSDWTWLAICVLSSGIYPVMHSMLVGEVAMLGAVSLQAAYASAIGAGLYRLDCRMRAQAGFEH